MHRVQRTEPLDSCFDFIIRVYHDPLQTIECIEVFAYCIWF